MATEVAVHALLALARPLYASTTKVLTQLSRRPLSRLPDTMTKEAHNVCGGRLCFGRGAGARLFSLNGRELKEPPVETFEQKPVALLTKLTGTQNQQAEPPPPKNPSCKP